MPASSTGLSSVKLPAALVRAGAIPAKLESVDADLFESAHLQHIVDPQLRSTQARHWAD